MEIDSLIKFWRKDREALTQSTDAFYRGYGYAIGDAADELADWLKIHYPEGLPDIP